MPTVLQGSELIWPPYSPSVSDRKTLEVVKAKGAWLYTRDGRKIFDAISSWWVNIHGHCHPDISEAISRQAAELEHVIFSGFVHPPAIELAGKLKNILPGAPSKIFFSDNGSTAVEVALKMAIGAAEGKKKIVAFSEAYHGDTFGAMAVSGRSVFNEKYEHLLFEPVYVPCPTPGKEDETLSRLEDIFKTGDAGAFIFEPLVLGAAGMKMYSRKVLDEMLALCVKYDVISIADEVFTGFGRTGTMFACSNSHHAPDIITVSKGITGGSLPLGVTACNERIAQSFHHKALYHGHSYTANPISCAASNASIDLFEKENTLQKVKEISILSSNSLSDLSAFEGVSARSCGTILAIEVNGVQGYHSDFSRKTYEWFTDRNFLIRPLGNVFYLVPPYCVSRDEMETAISIMKEFLTQNHHERTN